MRKIIRIMVAVAVITMGPVVGLTAATAAHAATCSGDGCSGQDPLATGCSSGAYTVLAKDTLGGYLELRWGPDCKTNWTRFTPGNNHTYAIWVQNLTTGVWAGTGKYNYDEWSNQAGIVHYSDQVYAPDPQPAEACVWDLTINSSDCVSQ